MICRRNHVRNNCVLLVPFEHNLARHNRVDHNRHHFGIPPGFPRNADGCPLSGALQPPLQLMRLCREWSLAEKQPHLRADEPRHSNLLPARKRPQALVQSFFGCDSSHSPDSSDSPGLPARGILGQEKTASSHAPYLDLMSVQLICDCRSIYHREHSTPVGLSVPRPLLGPAAVPAHGKQTVAQNVQAPRLVGLLPLGLEHSVPGKHKLAQRLFLDESSALVPPWGADRH